VRLVWCRYLVCGERGEWLGGGGLKRRRRGKGEGNKSVSVLMIWGFEGGRRVDSYYFYLKKEKNGYWDDGNEWNC
jgi:hypothetical protein